MQSFPIIEPIQKLFESHDIPYTMEEDWLIPYGDFGKYPCIRLLWFPYSTNGCLQVEVLHQDSTLMIECFAGIGNGEEAIQDGFQNFCINSFHVFAAAFWDIEDKEQVEIEKWEVGNKTYTAYIGNVGRRMFYLEEFPKLPENWFDLFESQIKEASDLGKISWFRLFVGDNGGQHTFECLKNNDNWDDAQKNIAKLDWYKSDGYYSIRNFIILVEHFTE